MSFKSLFEFGNVRITGKIDNDFPESIEFEQVGELSYTQEIKTIKNRRGRLVPKLKGFYASVSFELALTETNDTLEVNKLIKMINNLVGTNKTLIIAPRFESLLEGESASFSEEFTLSSSVKPEDIIKYTSGAQKLKLTFNGVTRLPRMYESRLIEFWEASIADALMFVDETLNEVNAAFVI